MPQSQQTPYLVLYSSTLLQWKVLAIALPYYAKDYCVPYTTWDGLFASQAVRDTISKFQPTTCFFGSFLIPLCQLGPLKNEHWDEDRSIKYFLGNNTCQRKRQETRLSRKNQQTTVQIWQSLWKPNREVQNEDYLREGSCIVSKTLGPSSMSCLVFAGSPQEEHDLNSKMEANLKELIAGVQVLSWKGIWTSEGCIFRFSTIDSKTRGMLEKVRFVWYTACFLITLPLL